jgi:hypothetical protein
VQPIIWKVIERWHRHEAEIASWEDACSLLPAELDDWPGLIERLQLINTFQWHEEDKSRDPVASDLTLAAIKRSIDASNRRRVETVQAFDELLHARLLESGLMREKAPLHSESPGSIVDRLTVLALKVYHVREALTAARQRPAEPAEPGDIAQPPVPDAAATPLAKETPSARAAAPDQELVDLYERLRSLTEQTVDLTECLDRLLADIYAGRIHLKLYRQVKLYGEPAQRKSDRE